MRPLFAGAPMETLNVWQTPVAIRRNTLSAIAKWRQSWAGKPRYERALWVMLIVLILVPRFIQTQPFLKNSYRTNVDEAYSIKVALSFGEGDLNPHRWSYPTFYLYLLAFTYGIIFLIGRLTGVYAGTDQFAARFFADPRIFMWPGRYLSLGAGVWQILAAKAIAQRVFGPVAGWITAFGLALSPMHVSTSSITKPDMFALLFATLAIGALCSIVRHPTLKGYLWAGAFIGLGTGTKYWPAFLVPVALGTHIYMVLRPVRGETVQRVPWHWVLWAAAACGVAFVVTSPYFVLAFQEMMGIFGRTVTAYASGGQTDKAWADTPRPFSNLLRFSVGDGGATWVVAFVVGCALALWRRTAERMIILVSAIVLIGVFLRSKISSGNYLLPSFPFLWMFAGFAVQRLARPKWRLRNGVVLIAAIALLAVPLVRTAYRPISLSYTDTWTLGERLFNELVPDGAVVYVDHGLNLQNTREDVIDAAQDTDWFKANPDAFRRREMIWRQYLKYARGIWYVPPEHAYKVIAANVLGLESAPVFLVPMDDFHPLTASQLSSAGVQYVVTSSRMVKRYERTGLPRWQFYESLRGQATLIGEVTPEEGVVRGGPAGTPIWLGIPRTGPSIFIYQLRDVSEELDLPRLRKRDP